MRGRGWASQAGLALLLSLGCGDDGVDGITGASRQPTAPLLDADHPGWLKPDCRGCHGDQHDSGYRPAQCTDCHGLNGEPWRPAGHADDGCRECHPDRHLDLDVEVPRDCRACHPLPVPPPRCPSHRRAARPTAALNALLPRWPSRRAERNATGWLWHVLPTPARQPTGGWQGDTS